MNRGTLRFSFGVKSCFYGVPSGDKPMFFHYFLAKTHFPHDEEPVFFGQDFFAKAAAIFLRRAFRR